MNSNDLKKLLPDYLEDNLDEKKAEQARRYLREGKTIFQRIKEFFQCKRFVFIYVTISLILISGIVIQTLQEKSKSAEEVLASLNPDDIGFLASFELFENFDVIADLEFFEDMDIIEYLDNSDT